MSIVSRLTEVAISVAPRGGGEGLDQDTLFGYGGYGMTLPEYLTFLAFVEDEFGAGRISVDLWPHTIRELAEMLN